MNITVVGSGYVGLSNALLLSKNHNVTVLDIVKAKVEALNDKILPIQEARMQEFLEEETLNLVATTDKVKAYNSAELVIIATPTDYDPDKDYFNTSSVELVAKEAIEHNPSVQIVIKSTVPVGFTQRLSKSLNYYNILFSPEFLREGRSLEDNQFPSRIIVGTVIDQQRDHAEEFARLLVEMSNAPEVYTLVMSASEAEAVKLFSNSYLAMRIAYFNELDTYSMFNGLDSQKIITGMCQDPRIGNHYNNPSFGYGGYCLPKDTKQLVATFGSIPQKLVQAIVDSNYTRKDFLIETIMDKNPKVVGIYRLIMKSGSDNFRSSAIHDIIEALRLEDIQIKIFEPTLEYSEYEGFEVSHDLNQFCESVDLILANRNSEELSKYSSKVFTRDVFHRD